MMNDLSLGQDVHDKHMVSRKIKKSKYQILQCDSVSEDAFKYIMIGYDMGRDTVQQKQTKKNKSKGKSNHHENRM